MKLFQFGKILLGLCALLMIAAAPAHAGSMCDWFGVGCAPVSATQTPGVEFSANVDQNHPPEVFAFTVSGTFENWAPLPEQTFICDTREREDHACAWRGHIPEIKRNIKVIFEPFAHDLGMYKINSLVENNLAQDPNYRTRERVSMTAEESETGQAAFRGFRQLSISSIASREIKVLIYKGNSYTVSANKNVPIGSILLNFKGALK